MFQLEYQGVMQAQSPEPFLFDAHERLWTSSGYRIYDHGLSLTQVAVDEPPGVSFQRASAPEPEGKKLSPVEFKLLFSSSERVALAAERATDPVIDDWLSLINDPRLTHVDLGLQSTRDAIGYLAAQGLIGAERVEQILAGVMQ